MREARPLDGLFSNYRANTFRHTGNFREECKHTLEMNLRYGMVISPPSTECLLSFNPLPANFLQPRALNCLGLCLNSTKTHLLVQLNGVPMRCCSPCKKTIVQTSTFAIIKRALAFTSRYIFVVVIAGNFITLIIVG